MLSFLRSCFAGYLFLLLDRTQHYAHDLLLILLCRWIALTAGLFCLLPFFFLSCVCIFRFFFCLPFYLFIIFFSPPLLEFISRRGCFCAFFFFPFWSHLLATFIALFFLESVCWVLSSLKWVSCKQRFISKKQQPKKKRFEVKIVSCSLRKRAQDDNWKAERCGWMEAKRREMTLFFPVSHSMPFNIEGFFFLSLYATHLCVPSYRLLFARKW